MLVNADFSRRASVAPEQYHWVPSPQGGVERMMLDRLGGEHARATSFVRYAPGSSFPTHQHPGGEEILILSGSFCEDGRAFPAGWYLRSPPGSAHQPSSPDGALIFVKLRQMAPAEHSPVRIDTRNPANWRRDPDRDTCVLFEGQAEHTTLQRLGPGVSLLDGPVDGAELVVIAGELTEGAQRHGSGSWIRLPRGSHASLHAGPQGATVYLKTGHLADLIAGVA